MKKKLLGLLAITTLGMVACNPAGNTSEQPGDSSSTPAVSSSSPEVVYPEATVEVRSTLFEVEVGNSITVKFRVVTDEDNKSVNVSCLEGDDFATLTGTVNQVVSVEIKGVKEGTAKFRATSVVNPNAFYEFEITVTATKPTLRKAFKAMIERASNYTITSTYEENGKEYVNQIVKVTEKGVTITDEFGDAVYTSIDGVEVYGYGVDQNNHIFNITKTDDAYAIAGTAVKGSGGLLNGDNFAGAGFDAQSPNDVGLFFGFSAINPNWLSNSKKDSDGMNNYVIEGEKDTTSNLGKAWTEYCLWNLADFNGWFEGLSQATAWTAIAEAVNTEISVTGKDTIEATVEHDGTVFTLKVSEFGTTELDAALNKFIALETTVVDFPPIARELELLKTALQAKDAVQVNHYYFQKGRDYVKTDFFEYYTKDYYWYDYPKALTDAYKDAYGEDWNGATCGGYVALEDGGNVHAAEYVPAVVDPETGEETEAAYIKVDKAEFKDSYGQTYTTEDLWTMCVGSSESINGELVYNYSTEKQSIFDGYAAAYYTMDSYDTFAELYSFSGQQAPQADFYLTSIAVTTDVDDDGKYVATGAEFISYFESGQGGSLVENQLTHLGDAASQNPYDALLKSAIAAAKAA